MNPALTAAFLLTRKLSLPRALLYLIAQCGGAILGAYIVYVVRCMTPSQSLSVLTTR